MKKTLLYVLIVVLIIQFLIPAYKIWEKYDVLKNGEEVKMRVAPIDPYDAFRGRYVSLSYSDRVVARRGKYGILEIDKDGFATVSKVVKKRPENELYIKGENEENFSIPQRRYYMEETLAPKAEKMLMGDKEAYVTIRIKGDNAVISGLYVDGKPIEEILTSEE